MGEASITWIIIILIIVGLKYFFKKKKGYRREYSLGLKVAEEVQYLIKNKEYDKAEEKVRHQKRNDITQIIDHLALSLQEKELVEWRNIRESDFSKLTLGVFYLHFAWITRSHELAENVSTEKAKGFYDYLQLCKSTFDLISMNSFYIPELKSREIRLYMSLGNDVLASKTFHDVSKQNPDFIWPYIHYSELIQSKWGGDIKDLESFYESLPNDLLIQSIVTLKLIHDSMIMSDNYFKKYNKDLNDFALQKVAKIDAELSSNAIDSIHKYILYNYMESVTDTLRLKDLRKKYQKLMDNNYTMYPYGLLN